MAGTSIETDLWELELQRSISIQKTALFVLIILAAVLRIYFGHDLPLSGDEVGVGVLQATGQAIAYRNYADAIPERVFSIDEIKNYIDYSENYGVKDVLLSLRHAGMHPPFYYIVLHYVIKFLNNNTITLRSVSILFSILSLILAYYLGKIISNESMGLCYVLFLTLSPYCLQYSVMVRPYPLLTFLALLSTLQIYHLVKNESLNFNNLNCYLYILTSVIGLYTMYHYAFIIFFQVIFVLLSMPKKTKTIITNISIYSAIIVLYIPWLPFLKDQLDVIHNGSNYYFQGRYNILSLVGETIQANFLSFPFKNILPQINGTLIKTVVVAIVSVILLIGCSNLLSQKSSKFLAISLLFYFISHYAGDWILESRTLTFAKFQFFLVPIFLFVFSHGIDKIPNRFFRAFCILLCCSLLVSSSIHALRLKTNFDGPTYIKSFGETISNIIDSNRNQDTLIITNTAQRRFLLSFVHEIEYPVDIAIVGQYDTASELERIHNIEKYDHIFVADFVVSYQEKPQFSVRDQDMITSFLNRNGLTQMTLLFGNTESTLGSFSDASDVHPAHPLDATMGGVIRLLGYDATLNDQDSSLDVTLYWQALAPVTEDYMLALQLVSPVVGDTTLRWNYNSWPVHRNYPTSIWQPGGVIVNRYHSRLPETDFPTQTWDMHLILYQEETGDRLPVQLDGVTVGNRLILTRLRIPGYPPSCPPEGRLTAEVHFGEEAVTLTHASVVPGQSEDRVLLCWKALQTLPADYTVFVHLQNASGTLIGTGDGPPMQGAFPTSMWHPEDTILDVHYLISESENDEQGKRIAIGLYKPEDGSRLPAYIGDTPIPDNAVQVWPDHP